MALSVHWYDIVCFAIVAGASVGSLWTIWEREGRRDREDPTKHESLLVSGDGYGVGPKAGHVGSVQLWKSCWRSVHPACLLVLRLVAAVAMAAILLWDIWTYDSSIMLYYTEWTFTLVIIYFAIATVMSAHGCWIYSKQHVTENEEVSGFLRRDLEENTLATLTSGTNENQNAIKLESYNERGYNEQKAGFWGYMMQVIYQTSAGAVMLTDVVFWFLLVPFLSSEHFKLNLLMGCMHSLNAVFLLLDTILNSLPFPWFRMAYFVLWSCTYVIFQWVLHACGFPWWPYPFLELATPWAPLWYLCLALVHIPCYCFYIVIVKAKNLCFPKFFPHAYLRAY